LAAASSSAIRAIRNSLSVVRVTVPPLHGANGANGANVAFPPANVTSDLRQKGF
jgi:hypothetical protein